MRELPLPLALTARLSPVVVLAFAGWALTSSPAASSGTDHKPDRQSQSTQGTQSTQSSQTPSAPATSTASKTYSSAPAPCASLSQKTITSLVPGAKPAGKEIPSTDNSIRRTCSWNALKNYDYRWLDVSFEIMDSNAAAQKSYTDRITQKSGGGPIPGLGDAGHSVVNLTTDDKQQTREGLVLVRVSNALVVVDYNGSNFETKKAPDTDQINRGAIQAARDAVAALAGGQEEG